MFLRPRLTPNPTSYSSSESVRSEASFISFDAQFAPITPPTSDSEHEQAYRKPTPPSPTTTSSTTKVLVRGRSKSDASTTGKKSTKGFGGLLRRMRSSSRNRKENGTSTTPVETESIPPLPTLPFLHLTNTPDAPNGPLGFLAFDPCAPASSVATPTRSGAEVRHSRLPLMADQPPASERVTSYFSSGSEDDSLLRLVQAAGDLYSTENPATPTLSPSTSFSSPEVPSAPSTPRADRYSFLNSPSSPSGRRKSSASPPRRLSRLSYRFEPEVTGRPYSMIKPLPSTPRPSHPPPPVPARPLASEDSDDYGSDDLSISEPDFWADKSVASTGTATSTPTTSPSGPTTLIKAIILANPTRVPRSPLRLRASSNNSTTSSLRAYPRARTLGPRAKALLEFTNKKLLPLRMDPMDFDLDHPISTNSSKILREAGEKKDARVVLGRMAVARKLKRGLNLVEAMELERNSHGSSSSGRSESPSTTSSIDSTGTDFVSRRNSKWFGPTGTISLVAVLSPFFCSPVDVSAMQSIRPPSASALAASKMTGIPVPSIADLPTLEGLKKWSGRPSFAESHLVTLLVEGELVIDIVRQTKRPMGLSKSVMLESKVEENAPISPPMINEEFVATPRPAREAPPTSPSITAERRKSFRPLLLQTSTRSAARISTLISKAPPIPGPLLFHSLCSQESDDDHLPTIEVDSGSSSDEEGIPLAVLRRRSRAEWSSRSSPTSPNAAGVATALREAQEKARALEMEVTQLKRKSMMMRERQSQMDQAREDAERQRLADFVLAEEEREIKRRQAEQKRRSRAMGQLPVEGFEVPRATPMIRSTSAPQLLGTTIPFPPAHHAIPSHWMAPPHPMLAGPGGYPFPYFYGGSPFPMSIPVNAPFYGMPGLTTSSPQFFAPPNFANAPPMPSPPPAAASSLGRRHSRANPPSPISVSGPSRKSSPPPPPRPPRLRPVLSESPIRPEYARFQSMPVVRKSRSSQHGMKAPLPRSISSPEVDGRRLTTGEAFLSTAAGRRISRVSFVPGQ